MLLIRKVIEHVCEKMVVNLVDEVASSGQEQGAGPRASHSSRETNISVDKVELYCNDQKLDDSLDLRTVRHFIWKSGGDLILHYVPVK